MDLVLSAASFACDRHRTQRRLGRTSTPYINHPIHVAETLGRVGGVTDPSILAAAILHDVLEDTETSYEDLVTCFGPTVANYVNEVSDDKTLDKVQRKRVQVAKAGSLSYGARVIKLADKLDNLSSLQADPPRGWAQERVEGYICWAYHVIKSFGKTNVGLETELYKLFVDHDLSQERLQEYYEHIRPCVQNRAP